MSTKFSITGTLEQIVVMLIKLIVRSHVEDVRKNDVSGQSRLAKCEISSHTHLPPVNLSANTQHPWVIKTVWDSLDVRVLYM